MHRTITQRRAFSWLIALAVLLAGFFAEPAPAAAESATTETRGAADGAERRPTRKKPAKKKTARKTAKKKHAGKAPKKAKRTAKEVRKKAPKKHRGRATEADRKPRRHKDRFVYEHRILRGETVGRIARKYGVTQEQILSWNDLQSAHLIREGRTLVIYSKKSLPRIQESYYEVRPGDTLAEIARKYKMTTRRLKALNGMKGDLIRPGRQLVVEVPKSPEPVPAGRKRRARFDEPTQLTSGAGYHVRDKNEAWGTPTTVQQLQRAFRAFHRKYRGSVVAVGDISKEHGGPLAGHRSHKRGLDVDLSFLRKGQKVHERLQHESVRTLDAERTWYLIHQFVKGGKVDMIFIDYALQKPLYEAARKAGVRQGELDAFFQYPRGKRVGRGIIRHEPGHDDHMHVRFLEIPSRTSRTERSGRTSGATK